mmetsp:Transcript_376/g.756  ORF Transcript_376/g.756 Transcript_376/m.756 type:complete len:374 (-) Transcript_376:2875-3996(-)
MHDGCALAACEQPRLPRPVNRPLDQWLCLPLDRLHLHQQPPLTEAQVALGLHGWLAGHHHQGHTGPVLGDHIGSLPGVRDDHCNSQLGVHAGLGHSHSGSLHGVEGLGRKVPDEGVDHGVVHGVLRIAADARRCHHRVNREHARGGLGAQHHAVRAVQHRVGNVRHLGACWAGVGVHGLEHVSGHNHRLASHLGLSEDLALGQSHLLGGDGHAEVASCNHDAVCGLNDVVHVAQPLARLDLGNDLDILGANVVQEAAQVLHVMAPTNLACSHKVNAMLHGKVLNGLHVLVGGGGTCVQGHAADVQHLALAHDAVVDNHPDHGAARRHLGHVDANGSVSQPDHVACSRHVGKVRQVHPQAHRAVKVPIANKRIR